MKQRFETRQWVPFGLDVVFAFFVNPHNLPKLMPEDLKTRVERVHIEPSDSNLANGRITAGTGSEILVSFRPLPWIPLRTTWLARITEFVDNDHFCDEQIRGPFARFRHCHRLRTELQSGARGTVVIDEIEYELPFAPLGRIGDGLVRWQLEKSFAERQQRLVALISDS